MKRGWPTLRQPAAAFPDHPQAQQQQQPQAEKKPEGQEPEQVHRVSPSLT